MLHILGPTIHVSTANQTYLGPGLSMTIIVCFMYFFYVRVGKITDNSGNTIYNIKGLHVLVQLIDI